MQTGVNENLVCSRSRIKGLGITTVNLNCKLMLRGYQVQWTPALFLRYHECHHSLVFMYECLVVTSLLTHQRLFLELEILFFAVLQKVHLLFQELRTYAELFNTLSMCSTAIAIVPL